MIITGLNDLATMVFGLFFAAFQID